MSGSGGGGPSGVNGTSNGGGGGGGGAGGVSGATGGSAGGGGGGGGGGGLKPCTDIRFDGIGESQVSKQQQRTTVLSPLTTHTPLTLTPSPLLSLSLQIIDDDLGPEETQMRVLGLLYIGCETVWYHCIDGEASRARILHVQGVDSNGVWGDPTIAKLSPKDLLRAEADAHAIFSRYIGESVPQRIGEPVYVDEVGGMVLELVGACWRMPELAHTQATLSNTFSEVIKYDNDHAIEIAAPITARDRPVFGEVRAVIDEVILGQLSQVVRQTAHREPELSLRVLWIAAEDQEARRAVRQGGRRP